MEPASVALVVIAVAELVAAVWLLEWRSQLGDQLEYIQRDRRRCHACITGASVTSFKSPTTFCDTHAAHWTLIRDLEANL